MARTKIDPPAKPIEPPYLAVRGGRPSVVRGVHVSAPHLPDTLGEVLRERIPLPPPDADIEAIHRDAVARDRARIERRVHEAMLTLSVDPTRIGPADPHGAWPHYPSEATDYAGELRDVGDTPRRKWKPTPAQIDDSLRVVEWFAGFWNNLKTSPDHPRGSHGLVVFQRVLLELRAWQSVFGRPSWRGIESAMADRPSMPTRSHTWWKGEHDRLINVAHRAARRAGHL